MGREINITPNIVGLMSTRILLELLLDVRDNLLVQETSSHLICSKNRGPYQNVNAIDKAVQKWKRNQLLRQIESRNSLRLMRYMPFDRAVGSRSDGIKCTLSRRNPHARNVRMSSLRIWIVFVCWHYGGCYMKLSQ